VSLWHGNKGVIAKVLPEEDMPMPRIDGLGDDVLDSADLVDEAPAVEEDEVDEGYFLEEEDEDLEKEEEEDEGLGLLGGVDEEYLVAAVVTQRGSPSGEPLCIQHR